MNYLTVAEGRELSGLRLVLTAGRLAPWSESAKAVLTVAGVDFKPVLQVAGQCDPELEAWTSQTNAPVAVLDDESPRSSWLEIVQLADRLSDRTSLIPDSLPDRIAMFGWLNEIAGEQGLGWQRRLLMFKPTMESDDPHPKMVAMANRYGYSDTAVEAAAARCVETLNGLHQQLMQQQQRGEQVLVGDRVSALDLYWAVFSILFAPMSEADCPVSDFDRAMFRDQPQSVADAVTAELIAHRDWVWREVIGLPITF